MTQSELALAAGVSRQWIVALEAGKPGAEMDLVLRTCNSLGVHLDVRTPQADAQAPSGFPGMPSARKRP